MISAAPLTRTTRERVAKKASKDDLEAGEWDKVESRSLLAEDVGERSSGSGRGAKVSMMIGALSA